MEEEIETTDAETLLNQALEEKRLAEEKATKYENRFKKTAKELNDYKAKGEQEPVDVNAIVEKRISEERYYLSNPVAEEFRNEIEAIRKDTNLPVEKAYKLFLAENKPDLLAKTQSTAIDGVSQSIQPKKDYRDMSLEEMNEFIASRKG